MKQAVPWWFFFPDVTFHYLMWLLRIAAVPWGWCDFSRLMWLKYGASNTSSSNISCNKDVEKVVPSLQIWPLLLAKRCKTLLVEVVLWMGLEMGSFQAILCLLYISGVYNPFTLTLGGCTGFRTRHGVLLVHDIHPAQQTCTDPVIHNIYIHTHIYIFVYDCVCIFIFCRKYTIYIKKFWVEVSMQ
jgi:hypothetical protein